MATARFGKALAAVALFNGVLFLSITPEAQAGPDADARRYTMELKTAKDAKTKANALHELGKLAAIMKSYAEDALPEIYKSLDDKDASVRAAAAQALGACDEPADKAVPALVKLLKDDKDDSVKIGAAKGLGSMGPNAKGALPTLREYAGDKASKIAPSAKAAMKAIAVKGM
ncbi:MAG: HEAT repeat domain-containing protein [Planctomycetes bacterium]|nr:HEAT repeat domain-containing protein [Planctomycetota bacterium]